jgi:flagellar hook-associated protein 3 FlgL
MRITENSIAYNFLVNVNKSRERIADLQSQMATGKRILKPSDDPSAAESILMLRNSISRNEQFQKNVADGQAMLEMTASVLNDFSEALLSAKETMTKARNGSKEEALSTFAEGIDKLLSEAIDLANTQFNGKYLFGGVQTTTKPFTLASDGLSVSANPSGITGSIEYPVSDALAQTVNIDGNEAFQGTQMFDTLIQVRDTLKSGQMPTDVQYNQVSSFIGDVLAKASKAGSMLQNLDATQVLLGEQHTQLTSLISLKQDTDVAESITRLNREQLMLETALNTGAKIIPTSLIDFL